MGSVARQGNKAKKADAHEVREVQMRPDFQYPQSDRSQEKPQEGIPPVHENNFTAPVR